MASSQDHMTSKDIENDIKRMLSMGKSTTQPGGPSRTLSDSKPKKKRKNTRANTGQQNDRQQPNTTENRRQTGGGRGRNKPGQAERNNQPNPGQPHPASPAGSRNQEPVPRSEALAELELDFLYPLKKKSPRFPTAMFYCRLCDYHCDNIGVCYRHRHDVRHKRLKTMAQRDIWLRNLPPPQPAHIAVLGGLLDRVADECMCTPHQLQQRTAMVGQLQQKLAVHIPGIELSIFGSTASGLALKSSDLNIDVSSAESPKLLIQICKLLKADTSGDFAKIETHYQEKVPHLRFGFRSAVDDTWQEIQLTCNNRPAVHIAHLLKLYADFSPLTVSMNALLRAWANIVRADNQSSGTLPTYVISLMVVYYLQQRDFLPVLHEEGKPRERKGGEPDSEYIDDPKYLENLKQTKYPSPSETIAELFVGLLRFYAVTFDLSQNVICIRRRRVLPRSEKKWSNKKLAVEDPFLRKRNVARSVSHTQVFEYIYDRLRAAYQYFGVPQTVTGPLFTEIDENMLEKTLIKDMQEKNRRANSEGDCSNLSNNSGSRQNSLDNDGEDVIIEGITELSVMDNDDNNTPTSDQASRDDQANSEETQDRTYSTVDEFAAEISQDVVDSAVESVQETVDDANIPKADKVPLCEAKSVIKGSTHRGNGAGGSGENDLFDLSMAQKLTEEQLVFHFNEDVLLDDGKLGPAIMCGSCLKEGHLKSQCPEDLLPPLEHIPPATHEYLCLLDQVLAQVPGDFEPTVQEVEARQQVLYDIESYIRDKFNKDARLSLFGSSVNGFGFQHSDLDISMVFENQGPEGLYLAEILEKLYHKLKHHPALYAVSAITTAKVPILKFKHRHSQLEGDISLYNTLAQHNTAMLHMYSAIDPRVKALGYTMKVFAKICDICDASRGSLSSYAYTLMVIYYLQQRKPPVIPVLQEIYAGQKPERIVDGWNAWYYDDIEQLPQMWPEWGQNKESLAELWTGLLKFYTEEFLYSEHVISIRQREPLMRFEKPWNGRRIAIEDPFDLGHNLGGGLSRKMNTHIMMALRNGRRVFCTPITSLPGGFNTFQDYLFDPNTLTNGCQPPNDRGCRVCSKIGHFAKECPVLLARQNRKERERELRNERERGNVDDQDDNEGKAAAKHKQNLREGAGGGGGGGGAKRGGMGRGRGRGRGRGSSAASDDRKEGQRSDEREVGAWQRQADDLNRTPDAKKHSDGGAMQGFVVSNSKFSNSGARPKQNQRDGQRRYSENRKGNRRYSENENDYQEEQPGQSYRDTPRKYSDQHQQRQGNRRYSENEYGEETPLAVHRGKFTVTLGDSPPNFSDPKPRSSASTSSQESTSPSRRKGKKKKQKQQDDLDSFITAIEDEIDRLEEEKSALNAYIKQGLKVIKRTKQDRDDPEIQQEYRQTQTALKKKQQRKKQLYITLDILKESLDYMCLPEENLHRVHDLPGFVSDLGKEVTRAENAVSRLQNDIKEDWKVIQFYNNRQTLTEQDAAKLEELEIEFASKQEEVEEKLNSLTVLQGSLDFISQF